MAKKVIMSVDDEEIIVNTIKDILEPQGYEVVTAISGEEALEKLKKIKPDLILLDLLMPRMSGTDLCSKIRADEKLKNLKVVFVTVIDPAPTLWKDLKRMNVLDYIRKPFNYEDLIERIKKAIGD